MTKEKAQKVLKTLADMMERASGDELEALRAAEGAYAFVSAPAVQEQWAAIMEIANTPAPSPFGVVPKLKH